MFGDVTSANVVGYQQVSANTGYTMMSPTFLGVGNAEGCTLDDLTVTGNTGDTKGAFRLRLLDNTGSYSTTYYWHNTAAGKFGWYRNAAGSTKVDGSTVPIAAGRGVWCECATENMKLQPAGQVNESLVVFDCNSGYTAAGNCTPVDLTLEDLSVTGNVGDTKGVFRLRLLDNTGAYSTTYYWHNTAAGKLGWYRNAAGSTKVDGTTVPITAGRGLWCECAATGYKLNIPAPKLSK